MHSRSYYIKLYYNKYYKKFFFSKWQRYFFMVYQSCRHRVYPNQKQESLFKQYLRHSRFIHNNIIGEIEYNRRIANLFHARAPYVNNKYVESIFKYLREGYYFIDDLDINTMQACYKPALQAYENFFKRGFGHPKFKKKYQSSQSVKNQQHKPKNTCTRW